MQEKLEKVRKCFKWQAASKHYENPFLKTKETRAEIFHNSKSFLKKQVFTWKWRQEIIWIDHKNVSHFNSSDFALEKKQKKTFVQTLLSQNCKNHSTKNW